MKINLKFAILVIIFFAAIKASSQDLRNDSSFFYSKLSEYESWLASSGFKQVLQIDSLNISAENVSLYFGSHFANMDTLAAAWCQIKKKYNSKTENAIYSELFDRFAFDMEIGRDSAAIYIIGKTSYLFNIKVVFNKELIVNEEFAPCQTMGRSSIKFDVKELNCIGKDTTLKIKETMYNIRAKIENYFREYYKGKGAYSKEPKIDILSDNRAELSFEVTNINKLVLDRGFFEYHQINIEVKKEEGGVVVDLNLLAKYGSGLFNAPRKSEYKDMEPKYSDYVRSFEAKLKNNIVKLLTD
jgi:hypothetical protein